MNVKFTLHNHYYKKYTLENIDLVPEKIHNLELRCFEHSLLRIYQFIIYNILDRRLCNTYYGATLQKTFNFMIFLDGTSGFQYGQVVLIIHLSVGQVDFFDEIRALKPNHNFGNSVYPALPVSFGGDTKSRWSLLFGVYARGSKRSHQSALECVTVVDSTTHSNPPPRGKKITLNLTPNLTLQTF